MDLSIPRPPAISPPAGSAIATLRARIARMEHVTARPRGPALPLGPSIDAVLPAGGLPPGALHEAAGAGPDTEHGAAAALFVAGLLALKWLSKWLESDRWYLFGIYCLAAAVAVGVLHRMGY